MKRGHAGFTLFEVILAIALAAVLLTLIGTAINLYLVQVDSGRTRVEEAQLARSVLSMIADDIRATSVYKPQDTSAIAQLMAATAKYDVDAIDKAAAASGGVGKASAIASTTGGARALSSLSAASSASGSTSASAGSSGSGSTDSADTDTTLALGINGSVDDGIYVDATRLPRQEEIFSTTTGYTNAQSPTSSGASTPGTQSTSGGGALASDLKTIHYFIRPGDPVEVGSASVTSLDPAAQSRLGGLVRQEIPRAMRNYAEKNGGSDVLNANAVLLAPEVVHMEIHYFNGSEIADSWDMRELKTLPLAVEVRIWVRSPTAPAESVASNYDVAKLNETTHTYRQVVYLPMAQVANAAASASSSTDSSSTTDSSSDSSSSSSGDTVFNQE